MAAGSGVEPLLSVPVNNLSMLMQTALIRLRGSRVRVCMRACVCAREASV